jgi:hypothetical protein
MNDKQQQSTKNGNTAPPVAEAADAKPKSIPVKCVTFNRPHPLFSANQSVAASSAPHARIAIEFVPSLRHHRIEEHRADKPARVVLVHETLIAGWEPA